MKKYSLTMALLAIIFFTTSGIAQWSEQTSSVTVELYTVSAVSDSVAWIGGASGTVLKTTDGGAGWMSTGGGAIGTDAVYNIYGIDDMNALLTTSNSSATFIYRTSDGGSTWTQVFTQSGGFLDGIVMFDSANGLVYGDPVGGNWELYKTTDGGQTWNAAPALSQNGSEAGWNNALFASDSSVYFGTNNSTVYYSSDMGNTWTPQTTAQTNSYSVWFNDSSRGLIGGETALNITTNGGLNWDTTSALPGTGSIGSLTGVGNMWWAARQTNEIYHSTDNGTSWTLAYTAPTTGAYYAMSKSRDDSLIIAVRSDGGISAYKMTTPVGITQGEDIPLKFDLAQNYPNPFNPSTTINFNIAEQSKVRLSIFDVLGEEVAVLVNGDMTAGAHQVEFNAKSLPSGAYFYKLQQGNSVMVKKMLLLK